MCRSTYFTQIGFAPAQDLSVSWLFKFENAFVGKLKLQHIAARLNISELHLMLMLGNECRTPKGT